LRESIPASPAIDWAAPITGDDRDVHGLPHLESFHSLHLPGPGHYRLNAWAHSQG
jgi:hypothetical protein